MVTERGVDIRQNLNGNALRLEFADGQRIVINLDAKTNGVWLAARSGGIEFIYKDGAWCAHDQSDLFTKLNEIIEQTIACSPLNSRPPGIQPRQPAHIDPVISYKEVKERHGLRNVLLLVLAVSAGFWTAQRLNRPPETHGASMLGQSDPDHQCAGTLPDNGITTVFPESGLHTGNPNDPEITLKNDHTHPALLILSAPQTAIPSLSLLVRAQQSATLHLPAGQYDMMLSVGSKWCNPRSGFSDGNLLKFGKPLSVQADKPIRLSMQTSGAGMEDFQLFGKTADLDASFPPPTFTGDGSVQLQRQDNGRFYLPGTIGTIPVTFMVDTGASVTSISSDLARQAGIHKCKEVQFQTANGSATGCLALVPHMTLGNFTLESITVAVIPNLETNLLGVNVLRNFQISQSDSTMLIARK